MSIQGPSRLDLELGWRFLQGPLRLDLELGLRFLQVPSRLDLEGFDSRVVNRHVQPTTPSESTQEFEGQNESSTQKCGIFSSSSAQTPSAELTVQAAFFSACFFCTLSPRRCGSFFGSTAAVGNEYSRAVLGKNKDKGNDREKA
ncbi:hypothetical protein ACFX1Q_029971 [Malus domestica]